MTNNLEVGKYILFTSQSPIIEIKWIERTLSYSGYYECGWIGKIISLFDDAQRSSNRIQTYQIKLILDKQQFTKAYKLFETVPFVDRNDVDLILFTNNIEHKYFIFDTYKEAQEKSAGILLFM